MQYSPSHSLAHFHGDLQEACEAAMASFCTATDWQPVKVQQDSHFPGSQRLKLLDCLGELAGKTDLG